MFHNLGHLYKGSKIDFFYVIYSKYKVFNQNYNI